MSGRTKTPGSKKLASPHSPFTTHNSLFQGSLLQFALSTFQPYHHLAFGPTLFSHKLISTRLLYHRYQSYQLHTNFLKPYQHQLVNLSTRQLYHRYQPYQLHTNFLKPYQHQLVNFITTINFSRLTARPSP
jgi:hypothetical protein